MGFRPHYQYIAMPYTTKAITDFLAERPLISIHALEQACGIPQGLLSKAIKHKKPLPAKHVPALARELVNYGLNEPTN